MNPETKIQNEIIDYLNSQKIPNWRMSGSLNLGGFPDILVCSRGEFIAMEVKTEKGKPTDQQLKVMNDIRTYGKGKAGVVRSVEDAKSLIEHGWGDTVW